MLTLPNFIKDIVSMQSQIFENYFNTWDHEKLEYTGTDPLEDAKI